MTRTAPILKVALDLETALNKTRAQRDALLVAAKIALPGLRHLAEETKFAGVAADAQMAANTLESAIKNCEEA